MKGGVESGATLKMCLESESLNKQMSISVWFTVLERKWPAIVVL